MLHSPGNSKLGNIPNFSLPSVSSCPAHTAICAKICYAKKLERAFPNVHKKVLANEEAINSPEFVTTLVAELTKLSTKKKNPMTIFRWHVFGDIKDIQYLYKMESVMKQLPNITFYAYTRNWSQPDWLSHLETLRQLSNFTLIASLDDDHIKNNQLPPDTWRVSYVGSKSITDVQTLLNKKFLLCPNQGKSKALCDQCKYCYNLKFKNQTNSIYFIQH